MVHVFSQTFVTAKLWYVIQQSIYTHVHVHVHICTCILCTADYWVM